MMFARRHKRTWQAAAREAIVPRKGWWRRLRFFVRRVARLSASPHAVAAGFAVGAFFAFSPFLGLHVVIALAIASVIRGNLIAAAIGTTLCNPLTLPFIWAATYEAGSFMLSVAGSSAHAASMVERSDLLLHKGLLQAGFARIWPVIEPMLIGSVPFGLVAAALSYGLVYSAVSGFQTSRRQRLAAHRHRGHQT